MVLTAENTSLVPKWGICVITRGATHYAEVKNALLYGDEVQWFPFEVMIAELAEFILRAMYHDGRKARELGKAPISWPFGLPQLGEQKMSGTNSEVFFDKVSASGLGTVVKQIRVKEGTRQAWELVRPEQINSYAEFINLMENFGDALAMLWAIELTAVAKKSIVVINPGALAGC